MVKIDWGFTAFATTVILLCFLGVIQIFFMIWPPDKQYDGEQLYVKRFRHRSGWVYVKINKLPEYEEQLK